MYLTFGEIMMRVAPEGFLRFRQCLPGKVRSEPQGAQPAAYVSALRVSATNSWSSAAIPS